MRQTIATLNAAMLAAALATTAAAHSAMQSYSPEDGATVTEVEAVTMGFDDPMRIITIALRRDGAEVPLDRETGTDPVTEFVAHPAGTLAPGAYTVEWRGLSADGHPMQGSFGFTLTK